MLDHLLDLTLAQVPVGVVVDHDDRGQATAANARDRLQREQSVSRGPSIGNLQGLLDGLTDVLGAGHVAGRAVADPDQVLAHRGHAELGIEGGDPVDVGQGNPGLAVNFQDAVAGEVALAFLCLLQQWEQPALLANVVLVAEIELAMCFHEIESSCAQY